MIKDSKKRMAISINKKLSSIIDQRGGSKYILYCIYYHLGCVDMPNYHELRQAGINPEGDEIYELFRELERDAKK